MAKRAFYEELLRIQEAMNRLGDQFEEARAVLPKAPVRVNKDLNGLAACIHRNRLAIYRAIGELLKKPTIKDYLGLQQQRAEEAANIAAEISRLQLLLREKEEELPTEAPAAAGAGDAE